MSIKNFSTGPQNNIHDIIVDSQTGEFLYWVRTNIGGNVFKDKPTNNDLSQFLFKELLTRNPDDFQELMRILHDTNSEQFETMLNVLNQSIEKLSSIKKEFE